MYLCLYTLLLLKTHQSHSTWKQEKGTAFLGTRAASSVAVTLMRTELEESAPPELVESAREFVFQDELDLFSKDTSSKDSKDRNLPSRPSAIGKKQMSSKQAPPPRMKTPLH